MNPVSQAAAIQRDPRLNLFKPIRMHKAADSVVAVLADAIRGGLFEPGDMLPRERDLAEQLDVSRAIVRQAIDILRRQGIVTVKRGVFGGTTVVTTEGLRHIIAGLEGPLHDAMLHIAEFRRILEAPAFLL